MPNEFTLVGENAERTSELLVMGDDGKYYEYDPVHERFSPVEPDERWVLFPNAQEVADEY